MNSKPPKVRPTVEAMYSGKWIAWNAEETKIIASGETLEQTLALAETQGQAMPPLEFVPERSFAGGRKA